MEQPQQNNKQSLEPGQAAAKTRHRALRHHAEGIFLAEKLFGVAIVNSDGTQVPVRYVGEQHVREDLGRSSHSARLAVADQAPTVDVRSEDC